MKEQESFFDRFTPVRRMQIFAGILLVAAVALLLAALEREPEHAPDRIYDMAGLYRITVPGKMNTLLFGETSILFSGDYSAPDVMMIVDPEKEPSGEFLPVDRNRAELKSMLLETLGVADIVPEGLEVGRVGEFEFSMLPGVEFDFTFKGHCGIGSLFFARDYSFTSAIFWKQELGGFAPPALHKLNNLQLLGDYRNTLLRRPVIDSGKIAYSADEILEARDEIAAARRFYAQRNYAPENLLRAIVSFQKAFRLLAETDEVNLIKPEESKLFFDCLAERKQVFASLRSEIQKQFNLNNHERVLELIRRMMSEATLESELEWREWAKRQLQIQTEKK